MMPPAIDDLPVALVIRVFDHDGVRVVRVRCPFCRRRHVHGFPRVNAEPGVRLDHCGKRPPGVGARLYRVQLRQNQP